MGFRMKSRGKFHNVKTVVDGIKFDSKKEAAEWLPLKLRQQQGEISFLRRQVRFDLHALGGAKITYYRADFTFIEFGRLVVMDVKGMLTPMYLLKKKWMEAEYGIKIMEV